MHLAKTVRSFANQAYHEVLWASFLRLTSKWPFDWLK